MVWRPHERVRFYINTTFRGDFSGLASVVLDELVRLCHLPQLTCFLGRTVGLDYTMKYCFPFYGFFMT
uniref:Uncharacterized protein n=1 Tax=Rhizophora mucronata TaxID=61149 RepID=A0A2P2IIA9_RHIMU